MIRRVHVHFFLDETELVRETVERVHRVYADKVPSLQDAAACV